MSVSSDNIFARKWQYYISRNVPVWHDSLTVTNALTEYKSYKLPALFQARVHRGFQADFYYAMDGECGRDVFGERLNKLLGDPSYIEFLQDVYHKNADTLLQLTETLEPTENSLRTFFEFYGHCICMLDITAMSSTLITDKLNTLFEGVSDATTIIGQYGKPKTKAPFQALAHEIQSFCGNEKEISVEAHRLHALYSWIPANFVGEPWPVEYFEGRLKTKEDTYYHVENVVVPPSLTDLQTYYVDLLSDIAELNEFRKAIFSKVSVMIRPVFTQIGKQLGVGDWKEVALLTHHEILDRMAGMPVDVGSLLSERQQPILIFPDNEGHASVAVGDTDATFEYRFTPHANEKEVRGTVAQKGIVQGKICIVLEPSDFEKFEKGDILCARMTSVDFIPIMKKAGAFVTDEGGLASHATIIAREYKIPCIVGTGVGTRIFQDGDIVEVDAEKGIVRKV